MSSRGIWSREGDKPSFSLFLSLNASSNQPKWHCLEIRFCTRLCFYLTVKAGGIVLRSSHFVVKGGSVVVETSLFKSESRPRPSKLSPSSRKGLSGFSQDGSKRFRQCNNDEWSHSSHIVQRNNNAEQIEQHESAQTTKRPWKYGPVLRFEYYNTEKEKDKLVKKSVGDTSTIILNTAYAGRFNFAIKLRRETSDCLCWLNLPKVL